MVTVGLSMFNSIGRASPRQEDRSGSISGPGHFSFRWHLIIQPSEVFMVEGK